MIRTNSRAMTCYLPNPLSNSLPLACAAALAFTLLPVFASAQAQVERRENQTVEPFHNPCPDPPEDIVAEGVRREEEQVGPNEGQFRFRTEFNGQGPGVPSQDIWNVRDFREEEGRSTARRFTTETEQRQRIVRAGYRENPRKGDNFFLRFRERTEFRADGTRERTRSDERVECK